MTETPRCPLCDGTELTASGVDGYATTWRTKCATCGDYEITHQALISINGLIVGESGDRRYLVSGHTRERQLLRRRSPELAIPRLTMESMPAIADAAPTDVNERVDRLIVNLGLSSTHAGDEVRIEPTSYPLGYCANYPELLFFIGQLEEQKLLARKTNGYVVTVAGWTRIRELEQAGAHSLQAFVAMSFDSTLRPAYDDGIKPAVVSAGYRPLVMFELEHSDRIDDRILLEINRSNFLIADFTGHRQGVYFEAGYALGQKKPVIWTCQKEALKDAHFDTRQYNHIVWESPEDLKKQLYNRIAVLVGPTGRAV